MKTLYALLLCLPFACRASILPTNSVNGHVEIDWMFATNKYPWTNLTFNIYATTSLGTPMQLLTNVDMTNFLPLQGFTQGTNWMATNCAVRFDIHPGHYYFFVTASNLWGEGELSDPAETPPIAPLVGNTITIRKLP